jgi:prepilin-type N-terminal cleavage/methylation domain-containing protein
MSTNTARSRRRSARARGLGLIEMMLALAISASVLTAVATAIDVSFKSYAINQENSNLMQRARLAMHRVANDIRTTALHQPDKASAQYADFVTGKIVTVSEIYLYMDLKEDVSDIMRYSYDPTNKLLMCINAAGDEYVVARGVEAFSVKMEPMKSEKNIRQGGQFDLLMRATINMTIKTDTNSTNAQTVTLSTSVMPRRNTW